MNAPYQLAGVLVKDLPFFNAVRLRTFHQDAEEDLHHLLADEGQRPGEDVHVVRKNEWMLGVVVLLDLDLVVLEA